MTAAGAKSKQSAESIELRKIRDRVQALGSAEWLLTADGDETFVEARTGEERNEIVRFNRAATPDEIDFFINAPHMVGFLLGLVDRAIAAARQRTGGQAQQGQRRAVNYAAEAAMKCGEPAFLVFLEQQHGLQRPLTDDRAAQKLRSLLRITSRKDLNSDAAAAERWRSLRAAYEAWRKTNTTGRAAQ